MVTLTIGLVFERIKTSLVKKISRNFSISSQADGTQKLKFPLRRVENIVGKGENSCHNDFKGYFLRVVKSWDCVAQSFPYETKQLLSIMVITSTVTEAPFFFRKVKCKCFLSDLPLQDNKT